MVRVDRSSACRNLGLILIQHRLSAGTYFKRPVARGTKRCCQGEQRRAHHLNWEDNTGTGTAKENDKVIVVAYFPSIKKATFHMGIALRKDGQALLEVPQMQGAVAETWIGFLSHDEKDASDSVYSGQAQ